MMGQRLRTEPLFYYFRLEDQIPQDHLLRLIDRYVDFGFVRERLKNFYSPMGRPSIDPEVLLRLLLVGYLHGITSERRLIEEVRMHLAYRWFTRLGFEQEIPDHSTFSKNRHGRFRQSGVFQEVFEEIVRRCMAVGLVEGQHLAVDGTLVAADASARSRVSRAKLVEVAQLSRTVREYLTELEQQNPVVESDEPSLTGPVSTTDPDAAWAVKGGPAVLAYFDNYLIDTASRVILAVEATPARFRQEMLAAKRMLEQVNKLGLRPESLGADKAYGSGEFLAWLLQRNIQPHIPVIDPPPNGWTLHPRAVPLRACRGRLLLSRRKATALLQSAPRGPRLRLPLDRGAVPRLPAEKALYTGRVSQALRPLARTCEADRPRSCRNASLREFSAGSLQNRSFVR